MSKNKIILSLIILASILFRQAQANILQTVPYYQMMKQSTSFDTTWVTTGIDETITLPLVTGYNYNANVDWGDESSSEITAWDDSDKTHNYAVAGTYTVKITGTFEAWSFDNSGDDDKITSVDFGNGDIKFKYLESGFSGCSNLATIDGTIGVDGDVSFFRIFRSCPSLTTIPSGLFDGNSTTTSFGDCFAFSTGIESIPSGLFNDNIAATDFSNCFRFCTSLTAIPSGIFDTNIAATTFFECFEGCTSLTVIPANLFDNNNQVTTFSNCFNDCTGLTGSSGELWLNPSGASNYTLTAPDYNSGIPIGTRCYGDCTGLSDYATIPTYWK